MASKRRFTVTSDPRFALYAALAILSIVTLYLVLAGCATPVDEAPVDTPTFDNGIGASTGLATLTTPDTPGLLATDALAALEVKGRAPKTGYSREQFGDGWLDPDQDGCDTRSDVLRRDALRGTVVLDDGCVVGATILDPYTATEIVETPGRDSEVDIEHVVALSDAWQKGAFAWTPDRRERFANDFLNVMAVDDAENRRHSDGDAATWLPPRRDYWCSYVARQIAVKHEYQLWVTGAERDAMVRVLDGCPGQPLPTYAEVAP